jgi:hypothetical protein
LSCANIRQLIAKVEGQDSQMESIDKLGESSQHPRASLLSSFVDLQSFSDASQLPTKITTDLPRLSGIYLPSPPHSYSHFLVHHGWHAFGKPLWLTSLEKKYLSDPDLEEVDRDILGIVRALLEAPSTQDTAVDQAIDDFLRLNQDVWLPKDEAAMLMTPERRLVVIIATLVDIIFEILNDMTYPSTEHDRCAELLIGLHGRGPEAFQIHVGFST